MTYVSSDETLQKIFQHVGAVYGYEKVQASYLPTKDFKVRWQRGIGWVDFQVSDYLEDAPDNVLEGLAQNLFERISGNGEGFSQDLKDWVTRPEFCTEKQPIFLARSRNLLGSTKGEHKDLKASLKRLQKAGRAM